MPPRPSYRISPPKRVAGVLCLDFVNTLSWRGQVEDHQDRLTGYDELVYWSAAAGTIARSELSKLLGESRRRPAEARTVLERALALRESLARLAVGNDRPGDLDTVNRTLGAAPPRNAIRSTKGGYRWDGESDSLEQPLHALVWSAVDLLTSDKLPRVRSCGDARCAWLFLDTSPTGRRRWCSMADCGNRAKVRRHYQRERDGDE